MSRLNPIWMAGRLNEALGAADEQTVVDLIPDGRIHTSTDPCSELNESSGLSQEEIAELVAVHRNLNVTVCTLAFGPKEFEWSILGTPALLRLLSINPEPCCWITIGPGAYLSVGPFLDYQCPLWEWLIRAATAGIAVMWAGSRPTYDAFLPQNMRSPLFDRRRVPLPSLVNENAGKAPSWLWTTLDDFDVRIIAEEVTSADDSLAVSAGLMEMHDFAQSHELAQSIEGSGRHRAGDYWHAIHHRREPDPGNAKYWLRKVGSHPIHEGLDVAARALISDRETDIDKVLKPLVSNGRWDAFAFVDLCEQAATSEDPNLAWAARRLQFMEMTLLLASTYQDATT